MMVACPKNNASRVWRNTPDKVFYNAWFMVKIYHKPQNFVVQLIDPSPIINIIV